MLRVKEHNVETSSWVGIWDPNPPEGAWISPHLDALLHRHVSQEFSVDAEETELALVVVDHAMALGGRLDESGPRAVLWALQGPQ